MMASACLPLLFRAVEIDGVPYWDGGYIGNPAIYPVLPHHRDRGRAGRADQSDAARRRRRTTSQEIVNRINEITFNASLLAEYRAIEFVAPADRRRARSSAAPGRANTGASTCIASISALSARS